jgi:phosphatidate cytidylyltransferase
LNSRSPSTPSAGAVSAGDDGPLMGSAPHTPAGTRVASEPRSQASDRASRRASTRRGRRRRRREPRSELSGRLLAAIPAIAVALFLVIEGGLVFALGMFVLGAVGMHELYAMYQRAHPARLGGFIALAGLLAAALYGSQFQILLVAVAALPLVFGLTLVQPRPSVASVAVTLLGIYWIGFALAHAVLLRGLPHGEAIVIDVLVGTFLGDTFAYFGGRMFGRRPLAPSISPNKTVEGLVIGMLFAVLGVWIAGRYEEWLPGTHALVLGLGVALVAPIGDLFESFVKREAGIKDSGGLFGAHGGVLDRLDAVLFAAVVSYYVWSAYVH